MTDFVLLLSPAGSGKTTLIANTVMAYGARMRIAVLFNDDGDPDAVDLPDAAKRFADVAAMTAGCFGCADADALITRLNDLDGKVDLVLIEPIGFTAAPEMLDVFSLAGKDPFVVTLVDALHLEANRRIGTLDGQVAAADLVLLTKTDGPASRLAAKTFVARCSPDVLIRTHAIDAALAPDEIHAQIRDRDVALCDSACDHSHGSHVHIVPFHVRLRPGTSLDEIRRVIDAHDVLRAKGAVDGTAFSMVHGVWDVRTAETAVPYITFYAVDTETGVPCKEALRHLAIDRRYASLGTADEVRDIGDLTLLMELIVECENAPLMFTDGHPVPNPEAQELLNEVRKRPGVSEELAARAVRARVRHFLRCGAWYAANREREDDTAVGSRLHAISVGIAWFCSEQPERITDDIREEAATLPLCRWLAKGLLARNKTNADAAREEVIADEAGITARWSVARLHADFDTADLYLLSIAYIHTVKAAKRDGRPAVTDAWDKIRRSFFIPC